ncbi:MAG: universal stress protein [Burkholderiales bacterium]|nr:universal stress protein [Burkholderiales bacterium]
MAYKSILVVVDSGPRAAQNVEFALNLARTFEARVTGLFAATLPTGVVGFDGAYVPDPYTMLTQQLGEQAAAAKAVFEAEVAKVYGVLTEWREQIGSAITAVCVNARYHDLVIMGQYDPHHPQSGTPVDLVESVVLGSGRPVLVVPYAGDFPHVGRNVLVGWDTGREATRAVTDALPLLRKAGRTTVMTVGPEVSETAHGESSGSDIALFLARQGVKVEVKREPGIGLNVGGLMLSVAADLNADLIVMGLYGHSRLRELMLGGASRTILQTMTVPVLMSH